MNKFLTFLLTITILSCSSPVPKIASKQLVESPLLYASGFSIQRDGVATLLTVYNPVNRSETLATYVLVPKTDSLPKAYIGSSVIRTPIESIACQSATHLAILNKLELLHTVTAFSEKKWVRNTSTLAKLPKDLQETGNTLQPNIELLMALSPNIVMTYPQATNVFEKLQEVSVPVVYNTEYAEKEPLAQAEWIKFFGCFYEEEDKADSIFSAIEKRYITLQGNVPAMLNKPIVMTGKDFRGTFYTSGGNSFMAQLVADAGGEYVIVDSTSGGKALDNEHLVKIGTTATHWFYLSPIDTEVTLESLLQENELYAGFRSVKNRNVFVCNTVETSYFEDIVVAPEVVLEDFINYLHPKMNEDYQGKYYSKID